MLKGPLSHLPPWHGMPPELVEEAKYMGLVPIRTGQQHGKFVPWRGYTWWYQLSEKEWNELRPKRKNRFSLSKWLTRLWDGNPFKRSRLSRRSYPSGE